MLPPRVDTTTQRSICSEARIIRREANGSFSLTLIIRWRSILIVPLFTSASPLAYSASALDLFSPQIFFIFRLCSYSYNPTFLYYRVYRSYKYVNTPPNPPIPTATMQMFKMDQENMHDGPWYVILSHV